MAHEQGAAGSRGDEPGATGGEVPDTPEQWGNNGLVGDGRYRLTRRLGRGGMAEVFAAEDVRLGRPVAVKLLRADLAEEPVAKARFTREAQSVAGLNHHAVVAVYDSGEEQVGRNVVPYIVMEIVNGRTVRELLIDADAPPVEQALIIVSGVLEALAYSHQHGIVHRDIKPANVIITETGSVKVMDFGIARALHGAAQTMTATGMVMGTPQYLSPEQALGKTIDVRSDLYAVGCLLFELLAMRPPFVGETPLAVVYQHVQDAPQAPSQVEGSAPPELDGLVLRALAKDPDDRFQSAEEMRGLVQYALRMLQEHGSHTGGLWNTGPVTTGATPPMGTRAGAGGAAGRGPGGRGAAGEATPTSTPAAGRLGPPVLIGDPAGDGGGRGGRPGSRGGGGGRRGRTVLFALLGVLLVGTAVLIGANLGDRDRQSDPPVNQTQTTEPGETREETRPEDDETGPATWPEEQDHGEDAPGQGGAATTEPGTPTGSGTATTPEATPTTEPEPTSTPPDEPEPSGTDTVPSDTGTPSETAGTDESGSTGSETGTGDAGGDDTGTTTGTDLGTAAGTDLGAEEGATTAGGT